MSLTKPYILGAAVLFACFLLTTCYNYSEILHLNASCSPKDTCSLPRDLDNSEHHNCDCGSLCVLHNTCCIDSPFLNLSSHFTPRRASCRPTSPDVAYFMVDTCPEDYPGPLAVRRRCEQNPKDWSDPFVNVPVTQTSSHKTYKSVFCAVCNGEEATDLVMWQVVLDCSSLGEDMVLCAEDRDFVLRNMIYVREKAQWGLWSHARSSDWMFRYLQIGIRVPDKLLSYVRECRPNVVSDCLPGWPDGSVREMCHAYMGVVYFDNATFRNVHCALCNYEPLVDMSCHEKSGIIYKSPTMNFGILVDIDLRDGRQVGTVLKKCEEKQVYDPFSKKCRTIECPLAGFVLKDGKCIKV